MANRPLALRLLSQAARDARRPPSPAELMGALQDTVHVDVGGSRPTKIIRVRIEKQMTSALKKQKINRPKARRKKARIYRTSKRKAIIKDGFRDLLCKAWMKMIKGVNIKKYKRMEEIISKKTILNLLRVNKESEQ